MLAPKHVSGVFFLKGTPHWQKEGKQQSKNPLILSQAQLHIWVSEEKIRAARICAPRSTVRIGFMTPFAILPLKQGGGPELATHLSMAWIRALRYAVKDGFRTPFSILPLTKGGGSEIGGPRQTPHCPISINLHLLSYMFHSAPFWPIPFPFFLVSTRHLLPSVLPLHPLIHLSSSFGPTTLWLPCHSPMALHLVIRCHNPLPSVHIVPLHLITFSHPAMCLFFSPSRLHLYGHIYSLST
jgi:hypothetical protein